MLENHWVPTKGRYVRRDRNLIPGQIANALQWDNFQYWGSARVQINAFGDGSDSVHDLSEEQFSTIKVEPYMIWKGVLTFNALKRVVNERLMRFPLIEKDEIDDKSKGDAVSKGIALLQLTWFIVQIIVRATQGLAITELELTTAALAGLNSVMYVFWWSKPRDVQCQLVILTYDAERKLTETPDDLQWSIPDMDYGFQQLLTSLTTSIKGVFTDIISFPVSMWAKILSVFRVLAHSAPDAGRNCSFGAKVCREFDCHHHTNLLIDGLLDFYHSGSSLWISQPLT